MSKRKKRLRPNKEGLLYPRKVLDDGFYMPLTFEEKVFTALKWLGFSNSEAWGVINPMSEASANSKAVMAARYSCNPAVKGHLDALNRMLVRKALTFRDFKGYYNPEYFEE